MFLESIIFFTLLNLLRSVGKYVSVTYFLYNRVGRTALSIAYASEFKRGLNSYCTMAVLYNGLKSYPGAVRFSIGHKKLDLINQLQLALFLALSVQ